MHTLFIKQFDILFNVSHLPTLWPSNFISRKISKTNYGSYRGMLIAAFFIMVKSGNAWNMQSWIYHNVFTQRSYHWTLHSYNSIVRTMNFSYIQQGQCCVWPGPLRRCHGRIKRREVFFSPPPLFFLQFQFPYLQIEDGDVGFPILEHCCVRIKQATAPKCMKCETFKEHFPPPTPFKSNIYSL